MKNDTLANQYEITVPTNANTIPSTPWMRSHLITQLQTDHHEQNIVDMIHLPQLCESVWSVISSGP